MANKWEIVSCPECRHKEDIMVDQEAIQEYLAFIKGEKEEILHLEPPAFFIEENDYCPVCGGGGFLLEKKEEEGKEK